MTDYGHDLRFGAFLTPTNRDPHGVVDLARTADAVGLDLVTFQDHPYQPRFLDTWTLLTYVAAQTEHVHVAPNVLNVPLRPPAVVARAAASLDLLSGGRVELGLGAGGFLDAVAAMGGPRLTPRQSVDALEEAIDVIRGVWDTTASGVFRVDGDHHHVDGAKRGPAPAHDIGIWLGAYKPRMLRLTGAKADGWLPSLPMAPSLQALAEANAVIDEAATAAGRTPGDVVRLLNVTGTFSPEPADDDRRLDGPPERWVERLTMLTRDLGFSTFILMADDAHTLEVYGREIAPAVREAVAAERAGAAAERVG